MCTQTILRLETEPMERVSKWVIVAEHHLTNLSAISWREQVKLHWEDDDVRFVQYQHA